MYDDIAKLKSFGQSTFDQYGNETIETQERTVFVQARGVYANEYYNAAQLGLKPTITLVISHKVDYQGEQVVEFHGKEYNVVRTDQDEQQENIRLICEERVNNG